MNDTLHAWLRPYYHRYREIMGNSRDARDGREPAAPWVAFPFTPFLEAPAAPLQALFRSFCRLCLRNPADMMTILFEGDEYSPGQTFPWLLVEPIRDGFFGDSRLYSNMKIADVEASEKAKGSGFSLVYRKYVSTSLLEEVMALESRWRRERNNARYLVELLALAIDGLQRGRVVIDPPIPLAEHLQAMARELTFAVAPDDREELLNGLSRLVPDIRIRTEHGDVLIPLGDSLTLEVSFEAVLEGIRLLHDAGTLKDLSSPLWEYLQKALRNRWFFPALPLPRCVTRGFLTLAGRNVRLLPAKIEAPLKILGNPFRLAVVWRSLLATVILEDGAVSSIAVRTLPPAPQGEDFPALWKRLSADEYLHLLVRLPAGGELLAGFTSKARPGSVPWLLANAHLFLEPPVIEMYPRNEFAVSLAAKFIPDLVWNLGLPFLAA